MNAKVHAIVATAVCGCALAVLCCVTAPRVQAASVQGQGVTAAQPSDTRYVSDPDWPREYVTSAGTRLTMYQPQVASWDERQRLVCCGRLRRAG